jgi:hypothetical protein
MFRWFPLFPESPSIWNTVNREIQKRAKMETNVVQFRLQLQLRWRTIGLALTLYQ